MSITTYAELQTAVDNWLDRTDLSGRVTEFIALAEARIGRRLRVRGVEARDTSVTTDGSEYYSLPSDFLEARNVQINSNPIKVLTYRTPEQLDAEYPGSEASIALHYTIIGTQIQLKPIQGAAQTLEIAYYKKLAALSDSNTTNWILTNAPDLLLYGSLMEAEAYLINDPRIQIWKGGFDEAMTEWNKQEDKGRFSGSHLEIRTATGNP